MSWKYPRAPIKANAVTDVEDINNALKPATEETFGQLNEHNWASSTQAVANGGAAIPITAIAEDAAFVYHSAGVYSAYSDLHTAPLNVADQEIQLWSGWVPLDNITLDFTCPQTLLWIHGSCQVDQALGGLFVSSMVRLAIRVDGQILTDSITGGAENDNDEVSGPLWLYHPLSTSFLLPVVSGTHKVELVFKTSGVGIAPSTTPVVVRSRELICLEMRR